ncbi:MAG TPA: copper-binding protein [Xanthobacteraceae bacterium]|jgi:Cu/Ag efflux protein CusF
MVRTSSALARAAIVLAVIAASGAAAQTDHGTGAAQTYHGTGLVRAVLLRVHRLIVDSEAIPGYMAAMQMSFPVEPAGLLDGVARGDKIEFDIDGKTATITRIKVIGAGK